MQRFNPAMDPMHELRTLLGRHGREGAVETALPGLTLYAAAERTEPIPVMYQPVLCLMIDGAKQIVMGDRVYSYQGGDHLAVSVDVPVSGHVIQAPYAALSLDLSVAEIAALALETADVPDQPEVAPLSISRAEPDLLEAITRLVRLLDRPSDIPVIGPMVRREILWRLLHGPSGPMVRQMGLTDSRLARIGRVLRRLRDHYAEPVAIEALAEMAGMSPATFHRHFKAATNMSPLQYQKRIRLIEARTRLLADDANVAGIGFSVGYDSPSQFSREYARFFGAPPGRDKARLSGLSGIGQAVA